MEAISSRFLKKCLLLNCCPGLPLSKGGQKFSQWKFHYLRPAHREWWNISEPFLKRLTQFAFLVGLQCFYWSFLYSIVVQLFRAKTCPEPPVAVGKPWVPDESQSPEVRKKGLGVGTLIVWWWHRKSNSGNSSNVALVIWSFFSLPTFELKL